eukprot:TRINITY_DN15768_c0_g1_i1.p1 TRINITY_DN15768_c0_g1~~TRINITY_DN15768_c0_g1_i1.p1  ORF type:complete len:201 (+),score=19.14 TRINITY_DN15768_c0_g1_i1:88-690(+)
MQPTTTIEGSSLPTEATPLLPSLGVTMEWPPRFEGGWPPLMQASRDPLQRTLEERCPRTSTPSFSSKQYTSSPRPEEPLKEEKDLSRSSSPDSGQVDRSSCCPNLCTFCAALLATALVLMVLLFAIRALWLAPTVLAKPDPSSLLEVRLSRAKHEVVSIADMFAASATSLVKTILAHVRSRSSSRFLAARKGPEMTLNIA